MVLNTLLKKLKTPQTKLFEEEKISFVFRIKNLFLLR